MEQVKHAEVEDQAKTARVIATFAKRAEEAALASGATLEDAELAAATTAEDAATIFADATAMHE